MAKNKTIALKEIKQFKEGLGRIRQEELLAEERLAKARVEAEEIVTSSMKKNEELIKEKRIEAQKEGELLHLKKKKEAQDYSQALKIKGEENKRELTKLAQRNLGKAVEFVMKKILE